MASISCVVESRDFLAFTSAVLGNFPHLINLLKEFLVMILSIMTQFSYSRLVVNLEKALLPNAYMYISKYSCSNEYISSRSANVIDCNVFLLTFFVLYLICRYIAMN